MARQLGWLGWLFWRNYEQLVFDLKKAPEGHLPAFWLNIYAYLELPKRESTIKWYLKPILERNDWES